jgi:hypothetical protein
VNAPAVSRRWSGAGALVVVLVRLVLLPAGPPAAGAEEPPAWKRGVWADENFFPIGVWLQSPANAARYKAAGINVYVGLWKGPTTAQLAELEKAGMPVICEQNPVALERPGDPRILGWMHGDEPDNAQALPGGKGYGPPILPSVIQADYQRIRAADPSRPVLLNLGQGVAWDQYIGRGVRRNHPEDYPEYLRGCDIASFDIYPVVHPSPEVAGRLEFVAGGVERLVRWTEGRKPVWNCIECTRISNPRAKATPAQVRSEVWMSLVRGSRGLIYFVHQFEPVFREAALLDDPEMLSAITELNRQIRELAPVLNSPEVRDGLRVTSSVPDASIAWMQKRRGDEIHVFAVNLRPQAVRGTFEWTASADPAAGDAPGDVEVVGEGRRVRLESGRFADDFQPYEPHVYRRKVSASNRRP